MTGMLTQFTAKRHGLTAITVGRNCGLAAQSVAAQKSSRPGHSGLGHRPSIVLGALVGLVAFASGCGGGWQENAPTGGFARTGAVVVDLGKARVSTRALVKRVRVGWIPDDATLKDGTAPLSQRAHQALQPLDPALYAVHGEGGSGDAARYVVVTPKGAWPRGHTLQVEVKHGRSTTARQVTTDDQPDGLGLSATDAFQTAAFSGEASASVPLTVPPGPGGFGPQLALTYSSLRAAHETGASPAAHKRLSALGRGWALSGVGYLTRDALVLGGKREALLNGQKTVRRSAWRITRPSPLQATVTDTASGTTYHFGSPTPDGAFDDAAIAAMTRYNCPDDAPGPCADGAPLAALGQRRLQALGQWSPFGYRVDGELKCDKEQEMPYGPPLCVGYTYELNHAAYVPYRLMLRKACNAFDQCLHYFYTIETTRNLQLYASHARLSRVVWAADPTAMAAVEEGYAALARDARALENGQWSALKDCAPGETLSVDGHTHPCPDTAPGTTVAARLDALQAQLDAVRRLELAFSAEPRPDAPSASADWDNYETFTAHRLTQITFSLHRGPDDATVAHGWSLHHAPDADAPEARMQLRAVQPWTGTPDDAAHHRPATHFAYAPDPDSLPDAGLLHTVTAPHGGHITYTYASDDQLGRGVVAAHTTDNGLAGAAFAWKRTTYDRPSHLEQSTVDGTTDRGRWAGSRVVLTTTARSCHALDAACPDPDAGLTEACSEQRFITNRVGLDQHPYATADGVPLATQPTERTQAGLIGHAYTAIAWLPHDNRCPVRPAHDAATVGTGALSEARTTLDITAHDVPNPDDPHHALHGQLTVRPTESIARRFDPRTTAAIPPLDRTDAHTTVTSTAYPDATDDNALAPTTVETRVGDALMTRTTTTYYPPADVGGLTHRVHTTASEMAVPGHDGLQPAGSRSLTYYQADRNGTPVWTPAIHTATVDVDTGLSLAPDTCTPVGAVTTTYAYNDRYGTPIRTTVAHGDQTRTTATDWDPVFHAVPIATRKAMGPGDAAGTTRWLQTDTRYDDTLRPVATVGPWIGTTTADQARPAGPPPAEAPVTAQGYDPAGRPQWTLSPAGLRRWTTVSGTAGTADWTQEVCALSAADGRDRRRCSTARLDGWGQTIHAQDAAGLTVETQYDGLGRAVAVSQPYDAGTGPLAWTRTRITPVGSTTYPSAGDDALTPVGPWSQTCAFAPGQPLGTAETRAGAGPLPTCEAPAPSTARVARTTQNALGHTTATAVLDDTDTPVTTTFAPDALGRVVKTTDALGRITTAHYNHAGLAVSTTHPVHGTVIQCQNAFGDIVKTSTPASRLHGGAVSASTDALGRITSVTQPDGHTTTTHYDTYAGLPTGLSAPAAGWTAGQPTWSQSTSPQRQDTAGTVTQPALTTTTVAAFDAHGRPTADTVRIGGDAPLTASTHYDPTTGDPICQTLPNGRGALVSTLDDAGKLQALALSPDCASPDGWPLITAISRSHGRITSVAYGDASSDTRFFDAAGRLVEQRSEGPACLTQRWAFDDASGGLAAHTLIRGPVGQQASQIWTYVDNRRGFLAQVTAPDGTPTDFTYDPLGHLESAGPMTYTYNAQPGPHRTHLTALAHGTGDAATTWAFSHDAALRVTEKAGPQGYTLTYDAAGHVLRATSPDGAAVLQRTFAAGDTPVQLLRPGAQRLSFGPAGYERELSGTTTTERISVPTPIATIRLQWKNGAPDGLPIGGTATLPALKCLPDDHQTHVPLIGRNGAAGLRAPHAISPLAHVYHPDHLGSPRLVTGADSLTPDFGPWGQALNPDASHPDLAAHVTGQRAREIADISPHLVSFKARVLDTHARQLLQPDPVVNPAISPFAYVNNQPTTHIDPTGRIPIDTATDWMATMLSAQAYYDNPSWSNAAWLAADVAGLAIPYLPNLGSFRHSARLANSVRQGMMARHASASFGSAAYLHGLPSPSSAANTSLDGIINANHILEANRAFKALGKDELYRRCTRCAVSGIYAVHDGGKLDWHRFNDLEKGNSIEVHTRIILDKYTLADETFFYLGADDFFTNYPAHLARSGTEDAVIGVFRVPDPEQALEVYLKEGFLSYDDQYNTGHMLARMNQRVFTAKGSMPVFWDFQYGGGLGENTIANSEFNLFYMIPIRIP